MCTVSYLPANAGYLLTVNRDEAPERETFLPQFKDLERGIQVLAPIDGDKGGTWIATDSSGRTACIMNGGLEPHERKPPYRMSRGLLVWQAFEADSFDAFLEAADPNGLEPFTLILFEPGKIQRWVWDGRHSHLFQPSAKEIHLWSSAALYNREQHAHKEAYFRQALEAEGSGPDELMRIHGLGQPTPFILDRPGVKTVSITQISYEDKVAELAYFGLEDGQSIRIRFPAHR